MPYKRIPAKLLAKIMETVRVFSRSNALKACVCMTLGLCFHFLGYECSRAASITLLAGKEVGLGNEAIPLTIALGSPLSGLVLYLYTKSIKKYGSKFTLRVSFVAVIIFMTFIATYGRTLKGIPGKFAIVAFYAFREIYVSLLSSQQWAFIAGTLNKNTSSYIVAFSGVTSIASAIGGCAIEQLVNYGGVQALLCTAVLACVGSCLCAELAYAISDVLPMAPIAGNPRTEPQPSHNATNHEVSLEKATTSGGETGKQSNDSRSSSTGVRHAATGVGHDEPSTGVRRRRLNSTSQVQEPLRTLRAQQPPQRTHNTNIEPSTTITTAPTAAATTTTSADHSAAKTKKKTGFWTDSWNLIWKHKMLQILFVEGVLHQLCGNMLNLMFHNGLRLEITDDATRAMLVGRFFATVNITSCALQCFVLPHILTHSALPSVLSHIPLFVLAASLFGVVYPSLISVMLSFGTIKVLEYSVMHSASEMIYMPLGHEVRYLGKELIRFFGHKLGKSGSSLVLSAMVSQLQPSLAMQSVWGAALTVLWGGSMLALARSIRERDHDDERELQRAAAASASDNATKVKARARAALEGDTMRVRAGRKLRSYSLDDSAIKTTSRSFAPSVYVSATPGVGDRPKANAMKGSGTSTQEAPLRAVSASRDANISITPLTQPLALPQRVQRIPTSRLETPENRSRSLDRGGYGSTELSEVVRQLAPEAALLPEEAPPVHPAADTSDAPTASVTAESNEAVAAANEDMAQQMLAESLPTIALSADPDSLDAVTDVSGSPEASIARTHGDSVDSLASLGPDYDRAGSFAESLDAEGGASGGPYGTKPFSGIYDEGEEDVPGNARPFFGSRNLRPTHASMDSLVSLERRASWEAEQEKKIAEAQAEQREEWDAAQDREYQAPVMLRVGSVSVSLNTLQARAERHRQHSGST